MPRAPSVIGLRLLVICVLARQAGVVKPEIACSDSKGLLYKYEPRRLNEQLGFSEDLYFAVTPWKTLLRENRLYHEIHLGCSSTSIPNNLHFLEASETSECSCEAAVGAAKSAFAGCRKNNVFLHATCLSHLEMVGHSEELELGEIS